ncbi:MAG: hypothetical protein DMF95_21625 [Acidobacteria bacterium]|nr:MAG: hypothetical protein DMF94_28595 [Acidobacteriota bacterium]PYR45060.1 MAG: hypothetical protein DMF95_21625 [Acidobacteriota bacterium]
MGANVIRDLLAFEVDAAKFLPSDDSAHGFDNMAGTLVMSPGAFGGGDVITSIAADIPDCHDMDACRIRFRAGAERD